MKAFSVLPFVLASIVAPPLLASDVVPPAEVNNLVVTRSGADVVLTWDAVTTSALGGTESVAGYRVYRGSSGSYVPDRLGGTNLIGSPSGTTFTDVGAVTSAQNGYYLVSAVDTAGNEGNTRGSKVTTAPVLSQTFTTSAADLSWSGAGPQARIAGYKVFWGTAPVTYDQVEDVGNTTSTSIYPLTPGITYYFEVLPYDAEGNLALPPSNEVSGQLLAGGGPTEVCGRISTNTTWGVANSPYIVTCDVNVYADTSPFNAPLQPAVLTLEPGVVVRFNAGTGLNIGSGANWGELVAQGTSGSPIIFTANQTFPLAGAWKGITFADATTSTTVLDQTDVEFGGVTNGAAILVTAGQPIIRNSLVRGSLGHGIRLTGGASITLDHLTIQSVGLNGIRAENSSPTIRNSSITGPGGSGISVSGSNTATIQNNVVDHGVFFDTALGSPSITGNTFNHYAGFPMQVGADDVGELLTSNTINGGTPGDTLQILGERVQTSATWPNPGFPMVVTGAVQVYGDQANLVSLNIGAGSQMRFAASSYLQAGSGANRGALNAQGTAAAPILFTTNAATPAAGQWGGLFFDNGADDATSVLDHVTVEYAGSSFSSGLRVSGSSPAIRNCTVRNSSVYGIYLSNSNTTVQGCAVSQTGNNGIRSDGGGSPVLTGNTVVAPTGYGIYVSGSNGAQIVNNTVANSIFFDSAAGSPVITGNTFSNYDAFPARVGADDVTELLTANTIQGASAAGRLEILGEPITASATWPPTAFPLVAVGGDITIGNSPTSVVTLTLSPGTVMKFNVNIRLQIGTSTARGALVAPGTVAQPIQFTTNNPAPAPGQWYGVYFDQQAVGAVSLLDHCVVEYAGAGYSANVRVDLSAPTIRNSAIRNSSVYGVYGTTAASPIVQGNVFSGNANFDVYMAGASGAQVTGNTFGSAVYFDTAAGGHAVTGNTFTAYNNATRNLRVGAHAVAGLATNTFNATGPNSQAEVLGETLTSDATWANLAFPYVIVSNVTVARDPVSPATLTISPGASLRFNASVGLFVGTGVNKGALAAAGTAAQPILFTTNNATPAAGQWSAVYFDSLSDPSSLMDHCIVEYGGSIYSADVRLAGVSPTIRNSTIRNSGTYGIYGTAVSSPTIQGNTFAANANFDVYISGTSNAQVTGNTFASAVFFDTAAGTHAVTGNTFNAYNNAARNLRVGAHAAAGLSTNTFNGTGASSLAEILGETLVADGTWGSLGLPYAILGSVVVAKDPVTPSTLTLSPGATLRFNSGTGLFIGTTVNKGALVAAGTVALPILLTANSATPSPGSWQGVYFDSMSVDATDLLDHVIVEYAGQTYSADVRLAGVSPVVRNSTLRNSSVYGIYAVSAPPSPSIQGNTFTGNANFDVYVSGSSGAQVTGNSFTSAVFFDTAAGSHAVTGNTFNSYNNATRNLRVGAHAAAGLGSNTFNGIGANSLAEVMGETLTTDASWASLGLPYAILGSIVVAKDPVTASTLTLSPGATLRFNPGTGLFVGTSVNKGALVAAGTSAQPILFTANTATPTPGFWQAVYFDSMSVDPTDLLDHVVVEYGGATYSANVRLIGVSPTIRNSTIRNSSQAGIYGTTSPASPTIQGNTFSGNANNYDVFFDGGSATVSGNTFTHAVRFDSINGSPVVTGNTFNGYVGPYLLRLGADAVTNLTGNTFNGTDATSKIEILGETLAGSHHWLDAPVPYAVISGNVTVSGTLVVPATLTLDPGVTIRFGASTRLIVATGTTQANLIAQGTALAPITFTSDAAVQAAGQWQGLYFDNGTAFDTVLDHVVVEYAGQGSTAGIQLVRADPPIRNSTIRFSGSYGILSQESSPQVQNVTVTGTGNYGMLFQGLSGERTPTVTGCTVTSPTGYGIYDQGTVSAHITGNAVDNSVFFDSAAGQPVVQNNILNNYDAFPLRIGADAIAGLTGNVFNNTGPASRIEIISETLPADASWAALAVPYQVVSGTILVANSSTQASTLTLAPGTTIRFAPSTGLQIGSGASQGALVAAGTPASPILFTTSNPVPAPGQWRGLDFESSTVDATTILQNCTVEYAGQALGADILVSNANPTIRDCTIRRSSGHGLSLSSANPTVMFNQIVDNAAYGVSLTSSAPTLSHNNFTGNTTGAINQTSATILDARFNWFGSATGPTATANPGGVGQPVTVNVAFDPWLGTAFTESNLFTDMFASTRTFKPGSFTRFIGQVAQDSSWTLRLFDTGNTVVRTIAGSGLGINTTWDGKDGSNTALVDGTYRFQFDATGNATSNVAAPLVGRVAVDGTFALAEVNAPAHLQTFSVGSPVPVSGTAAGTNFSNYTLQFGTGLFPTAFTTITNSSSAVTNAALGTWNTTGQQNGVYTVRLLVNNSLAEQTVVNVGTFVLSINTLAVDRPFFSPNGDGSLDEVTASSTLSTSASWTINVVNTGTSATVRTFTGSGQNVSQTWDGKLADGTTVAPEGNYRFDLSAVKSGQTVASSSAATALDLTPPTADITAPTAGADVFANVPITGDAFDPSGSLQNYLLEFGIGTSPLTYTTITPAQTTPVTAGTLGTWVTNDFSAVEPVANGGYQIRLTVTDKAGNIQRATRQVNLDNLVLGAVSSSATTLDVSHGDAALINFSINKPATVSLKIYPEPAGEAGAVQRLFTGSFPPGPQSFVWDGKGTGGVFLPDEAYVYVLEADAGSGRTDKFSPPGGLGVGAGSGAPDPAYNPYTNDFWTMPYSNSSAGRVSMQVTPAVGPVFNVFSNEPHEAGVFNIEWDGRDTSGAILTQNSSIYFPPPVTLRPNYIITTGNTPKMTGIASDPYRIFMSYANVSRIDFTLQRDAVVTVTILPPGVSNPSDPSGRTIVNASPMTAGTYALTFDPIDPSDPNQDLFRFAAEGPYTFAIQAVNATTGATSLRRGVLNMFQ